MSENKYNPPVNVPENVPARPESVMCVFFPTTQYVAVTMDKLVLVPNGDDSVALGYWAQPDKFLPITVFSGCRLIIAEKTIVVP